MANRRFLTLLTTLSLVAACGKNPGSYTSAQVSAVDREAFDLLVSDADDLWTERVQPGQLAKALELYQHAHDKDPSDRKVLIRLTRGWYFHGDSHTTDKATKIIRWEKAIGFGKKCIALNSDFADRIAAGEKAKDAVAAATADDVPCLYWTASAIGKWGKIQGIAKTLGNLPTVKAYVGRAEELNPAYFHYGPYRYWGVYYAVIPSFAGQDLEKSASYFEQSIAGAPDYLATRALRAENLAVKTEDVSMFMGDLQFVLDFDVTTVAKLEPENTLEKFKAKILVGKRDELFDKKVLETYDATK